MVALFCGRNILLRESSDISSLADVLDCYEESNTIGESVEVQMRSTRLPGLLIQTLLPSHNL